MDAEQIKATFILLRREKEASDADFKLAELGLNLLEHYLLEQKRQTELLEWIASIGQFFETQRREGIS